MLCVRAAVQARVRETELISLGQALTAEFACEEFGVLDNRRLQPLIAMIGDQTGQFIFELPKGFPVLRQPVIGPAWSIYRLARTGRC